MALKDNVLKNFFNSNIKSRKIVNKYRVFDDPTKPNEILEEEICKTLEDKSIKNELNNLHKSIKGAIREQIGSNKGAIREQIGSNKGANRGQIGSNKGAIRGLKREHKKHKNLINKSINEVSNALNMNNPLDLITKIQQLYGHQRKILFFIVDRCSSRGLLTSGPINNRDLCTLCDATYDTIKNAVKRLIVKNLIFRGKSKKGKGGFSCFDLREDVKNIAIESIRQTKIEFLQRENILEVNREQIGSIKGAKKGAQSFSSSSNIKTTTNLTRALPDDWQSIDYSFLANIGFTEAHLSQLCKLELLEPSIVQDSIYYFAFDLKHNNKASSIKNGDPLNYFMGIVSKYAYNAPSNYVDPILESMNIYLRAKEETERQKTEVELKLLEIEFRTWYDSLSDSEIAELIPDDMLNAAGITPSFKQTMQTQHLKKHFKDVLWPERRRRVCAATANWTTTELITP